MNIKLFNINSIKRNIVILGSITSTIMFMTSCSKTEEKKQEIIVSNYSSMDDIVLKNTNNINIPFLYIRDGKYDEKTLNKLNKDKNIEAYGLILVPSGITYNSIYKDIDLIKDIITNNKIGGPILYDIDKLMDSDYIQANCKLAEAFLDKLNSNGAYVGIYGTKDNIDLFKSSYENACMDTSFDTDINDYISITTDENNNSLYEDIKYVKSNGLNKSNKFVDDYVYVVKGGDSLSLIADLYDLKLDTLLSYNNLDMDSNIMPGDKIVIPNYYFIQDKKTLEYYNFEECSIGIDLSEYNCIPTGREIVNEELTNEIEEKLGYEYLVKCSLGKDIDSIDDTVDVKFKEKEFKHLDWDKIVGNVDFVSLRIGDFWLSKDGQIIFDEDEEFKYNMEKCIELDIPYFTYYISDGNTIYDHVEETKYIMNLLKSYNPNYNQPIYIDLEPYNDNYKNISSYDKDTIEALQTGLEALENNGFETGIYSTEQLGDKIIKLDELNNYNLWTTCTSTYKKEVNYTKDEISDIMKNHECYPNTYSNIIQLTCNGKTFIVPSSLKQEATGVDIDIASKQFVKTLKNNVESN